MRYAADLGLDVDRFREDLRRHARADQVATITLSWVSRSRAASDMAEITSAFNMEAAARSATADADGSGARRDVHD
jgi:hypothetical protein